LGGAIHVPGLDYVDYVVPAIFLEAVLIGGMTTALALAQDLQSGIIDRFRSLPTARSAVLAGRTLADTCRSTLALAFMVGLGLLVGFRFHSSVWACLVGIALVIGFGFAFTWAYAAIGLAVKDPQTAQMAAIQPMSILFLRQLGAGPRIHQARLATTIRTAPADHRHNQRRSRTLRRRTREPRSVAGHPLVRWDFRGLPRDLVKPVPAVHWVICRSASGRIIFYALRNDEARQLGPSAS
jgi:hypothetical protein